MRILYRRPIAKKTREIFAYVTVKLPVLWYNILAVMVILQLVLSYVLTRNVRKESLVERIRYQQ